MAHHPDGRLDNLRGRINGEGWEDVKGAVVRAYRVLCRDARERENTDAEALEADVDAAHVMQRLAGIEPEREHTEAAKTEADAHDIPVDAVAGTGKGGKVVHADVLQVAEALDPMSVEATDAARELADEHGIDLRTVEGTGKDGRVIKGDVKDLV